MRHLERLRSDEKMNAPLVVPTSTNVSACEFVRDGEDDMVSPAMVGRRKCASAHGDGSPRPDWNWRMSCLIPRHGRIKRDVGRLGDVPGRSNSLRVLYDRTFP